MTLRAWLIAGACVLGLASPAFAHPLDLGYLTIETTSDGVAISLEVDLNAAANVLGVDPGILDSTTVTARGQELADRTYARASITGCTWRRASAVLTGRTVRIVGAAACVPGPHRWSFPFVREQQVSPRFQLMVKQTVAGSERLTLVDKTTGELELRGTSDGGSSVGFTDFLWSGIEHIGVAPNQWRSDDGALKLPDGIDHIMFLLALMLGGGTLLQLIGIASGFTLGHSITLALAALDVVRPPPSIIEPLIALSIALAAVEAFTGKLKNHRWKIASGFGLIHGFGFATALTHLELTTRGKITALFGYNAGVEIGQIVVVLVVAPLVMLAHRNERIGKLVVRVAAAGIFVAGMYWFVQRAFG